MHRACMLACVLLQLAAATPAFATTWHVRSDGGDGGQCNGRADAPYPGKGSDQACAWKHPFVALPPGKPPRIAGGDTLVIHDGAYMMGFGAPDTDGCDGDARAECVMAAVPSGPSASQPTRILGSSASGQCKGKPPELWATERARSVLNLDGSSHVEIACLEITDHSSCIKGHNHAAADARGETARCRSDAAPFGEWGEYGIHARDSSNVLLRDLDIHGMAVNGVRAGRLRDWTLQRVKLRANGWGGWDGNVSQDKGGSSANAGRIVFSGGEIAWNGCGERYPGKQVFGCWGQKQGGYGDGLGTARSGGDWLFEDMLVHHNTSDGLDLLYMDGSGSVTIRRVRAEGNGGNQIKTAGPVTIENSIAVGSCAYFASFPTSNMIEADHCRAMGNTISLTLTGSSLATLRNNTLTGQGDCLLITQGGNGDAKVLVQNNVFLGGSEWRSKDPSRHDEVCGHYASDSDATVVFERNLFWKLKGDFCPSGNVCGRDPALTDESMAHFNATPRAGSPLIGAGKALPLPKDDFQRKPRGSPPDIGAIQAKGSAK
ncbi:right-handed parallel beta-helix repeat-containing protein [Lysobacter niastensis]|nr:right-handed parallel beta-helix repeat-containing protein [Lysobacter niastensis]